MAAFQVQKSPETRCVQAAVAQMRAGVEAMANVVRQADSETLGVALIQIREAGIDPLEAVFADGVLREEITRGRGLSLSTTFRPNTTFSTEMTTDNVDRPGERPPLDSLLRDMPLQPRS